MKSLPICKHYNMGLRSPIAVLLLVFTFFSNSSFGVVEQASTHVTSSQIVTNASFTVLDPFYSPAPGTNTNNDCRQTEATVTVGVDRLANQLVTGTHPTEIRLRIIGYDMQQSGAFKNDAVSFTIDPRNDAGGVKDIKKSFKVPNAYKVVVQVVYIESNGVAVSCPDNVYIDIEIESKRVYTFANLSGLNLTHELLDLASSPQTISSTNVSTAYPAADEMLVKWSGVTGAEWYELEWTYVNNYTSTSSSGTYLTAAQTDFGSEVFENNSSRITTSGLSYTIPLIYDKGFLIYRMRALYYVDCAAEKLTASDWTNSSCSLNSSGNDKVNCFGPNYQLLAGHETNKNWRLASSLAEGGKRKQVIKYFDGTERDRQSLAKNHSDDLAIVSEIIYDYQGRPAIEVMPVPDGEEISYHENFTRYQGTTPYAAQHFDKDAALCEISIEPMGVESGASRYYSENNPNRTGINAYIPNAGGYPFVQTEYEPDNTGRVRRLSGVGPDQRLGSGNETRFFYSSPDQEELDQLFGTDVGNAAHYLKEMTIDPNDQVVITYTDMTNKVIATGLTGGNPSNLDALKDDGTGLDLPTVPNSETTIDMLSKIRSTDPDTDEDRNEINSSGTGLVMNYRFVYPEKDDLDATYTYNITPFTDACIDPEAGVSYGPVVNLNISVYDPQCQSLLLDHKEVIGTYNVAATELNRTYNMPTLVDLETGSYNVVKSLEIDEAVMKQYADQYINDAVCLTPYSTFLANATAALDFTDCDDMLSTGSVGYSDCVDDLGPVGNYASQAEYDALVEECKEAFTAISVCDEIYRSMLEDVSPGGQYGGYEVDDNGNYFSHDPLSVFNDGSNSDYPNMLPEILLGGSITVPGSQVSMADVLAIWDESWASDLVQYHPEYEYYQVHYAAYCDKSTKDNDITTQEYDWLLQNTISSSHASDLEYVNLSTTLDLYSHTGSNLELLDNDPLFSIPANNALKTAIQTRLQDYDGNGRDIYEFAAYAARCSNWYGDDQSNCPNYSATYGSSTDVLIKDKEWNLVKALYLEVKYEVMYNRANTQAISNSRLVSPGPGCAVCIGVQDADIYGYFVNLYNAPSGTWPSPYGKTELNDDLDAQKVCGRNRSLYRDKERRFAYSSPYMPANSQNDISKEDAEEEIYASTGVCPINMEIKNLIEDMGSSALDITQDIDLWLVDGFSPDLYLEVSGFPYYTCQGGGCSSTNYAKYVWSPSGITNGGLRLSIDLDMVTSPAPSVGGVTAGNLSNFLILDLQSGSSFSWNNYGTGTGQFTIQRVRRVVPNPALNSGSQYGLSLEVEMVDDNGNVSVEVLTALLDDINPDNCSSSFTASTPHSNTQAAQITDLFNQLVNNSEFLASSAVDLELSPYQSLFRATLKPALQQLNPLNTNSYEWNHIAGTEYEIAASGADNKYRIYFCSAPTFSSGTHIYHFRNLRPVDPNNLPSCTANGQTPNFQIELVEVDLTSIPGTISESATPYYGYMDIYDLTGGSSGTGGVVSLLDPGYTGTPFQPGPSEDCEEQGDARMALQKFLNQSLPLTYQDVVYTSSGGSNLLDDVLYDQLGPVSLFDPNDAGLGSVYYSVFPISQEPGLYVGTFYYGHGTLSAPPMSFDDESGEYRMDLDASQTNAYGTIPCSVNLKFVDVSNSALDVEDISQITLLKGKPETYVNGVTNQFTAIAIMSDGSEEEIEGESCFQFSDCVACTSVAPAVPTNCWAEYEDFLIHVVDPLDLSEYQTNFTSDDYCDLGITCLSDYMDYLTAMDIQDVSSPYYISIQEFCNKDMSYYLGYYKDYMPDILGGGTSSNFRSYLPTTYEDQFVLLRDFVSAGVGSECVSQYASHLITDPNPLDIIAFCSGVGYEYPCPLVTFIPFPSVTITDNPCDNHYNNLAKHNADQAYDSYIAEIKADFIERYKAHILTQSVETFDRQSASIANYHFTLYYYDQVGNLVKTIPPRGVKLLASAQLDDVKLNRESGTIDLRPPHVEALATTYEYNSLNLLSFQKSPDQGIVRLWYDQVGRLILSQNAEQEINDYYSYTIYDDLGRVIEAGTLSTTTTIDDSKLWDETFPLNLNATRSEVYKTFFDQSQLPQVEVYYSKLGAPFQLENLRGRVSATAYYSSFNASSDITDFDHATYYSYDEHGNIKTLIQDFKAHFTLDHERYKRMDYGYDLVSGNLNDLTYQKNEMDQFVHLYEYDDDNRLVGVMTSRDGVHWENDASYNYYSHGPAARTEIGEALVQGIDYSYTIEGKLKSVNSSTLKRDRDMGRDNWSSSSKTAVDAFGFSLHYYDGDYDPISTYANEMVTDVSDMSLNSLFKGNVSGMVSSILDNVESPMTTYGYKYGYDQLSRLKSMDVYKDDANDDVLTSNSFVNAPLSTDYKVRLEYDANGNITDLERNGYSASGSLAMDDLTYTYAANTNQLTHVDDAVSSGSYGDDLDDQSPLNYEYDAIGNLISDNSEEIATINWTVGGKVKDIIRSGSSSRSDLSFEYDSHGNRIVKILKPDATPSNWTYTYYVKDASGHTMAVYENKMSQGLELKEYSIFGSDRLGVYEVDEAVTTNFNEACAGVILNMLKDRTYEFIQNCPSQSSVPVVTFDASSARFFISAIDDNIELTSTGTLTNLNTSATGTQLIITKGQTVWVNATSDVDIETTGTFEFVPLDGGISIDFEGTYRITNASSIHTAGNKKYELKNHLGNVLAVVSDQPYHSSVTGDDVLDQDDFSDGTLQGWSVASSGITASVANSEVLLTVTEGRKTIFKTFSGLSGGGTYKMCFTLQDVSGNMNVRVRVRDVTNNVNLQLQGYGTSGTYCYEFTLPSNCTEIYASYAYWGSSPSYAWEAPISPAEQYKLSNIALIKTNTTVLAKLPDVLSAQDYYPFGMIMEGRKFHGATGMHRYGFHGKEQDEEVYNTPGSVYDYGFRIYNPRLGKFLSVDPLTANYPWYTPYQFAGNKPIEHIDLDGLEEWYYMLEFGIFKDPEVTGPRSEEEMNRYGYYSAAQVHEMIRQSKISKENRRAQQERIQMIKARRDYQRNQNPFWLLYEISGIRDATLMSKNIYLGDYTAAAAYGAFLFVGNLDAIAKGGKVAISYSGIKLYTKNLDEVWSLNNFWRGAVLESALAKSSMYRNFRNTSWWTPVVDFWDAGTGLAISLKTVNAQGNATFENILKNIDELVTLKKGIKNFQGRKVTQVQLDIAIPKGYDAEKLTEVLKYAKKRDVKVNVYEVTEELIDGVN